MARLAGYLRVSHVGGREHLRSPQEQRTEIEAWAVAQGHVIDFLPAELDAKGSDAERPIFRQAVEGVKAGRYSGVVVAYLSRAGRDLRLMLNLWDEVEAVGGAVYSARENIDGSTPSGRLHRNLLASIAQHELEDRSAGFERAAKAAVERGIWQRRQTPRGYSRDPKTRRLAPNAQAGEVRQAAQDFLAGRRVVEIAGKLRMTPGGVRAMLRNRVYLGELKVRSYVNPDAHPAILDAETFAAVQERLGNAPRPGRNVSREKALLAGLARCVSCGHVMTRSGTKPSGTYTYNYMCPTHHSGGRCPGPAGISCRRLDAHVTEIALVELDRLSTTTKEGRDLDGERRELAAAKAERSAYLEAVEAAGIGASDAAAGMRKRQERVERVERDLEAKLARVPRLPTVEAGSEIWPELSESERNDLLRHLFAAVLVRPAGAGHILPVAERVRVLRYGAAFPLPVRRGATDPIGIVPLGWPDADGVDVLRVSGVEDSF